MRFRFFAALSSLAVIGSAHASVTVFLDFNGFDANVAAGWNTAGYGGANALTAGEILGIKTDVQTKLATIYNGFTTTFTQSNPGGVFETLRFGQTTTNGGLFGQAERIDWRNNFKDDIADIYAQTFNLIVLPGSYNRTQNLERLKNALAGTAAHEFGHNLGLQHYDPFGTESIRAPLYNNVTGQQNNFIMATGSTGLTLDQRGEMRSFNTMEKVKLQYADEMAAVEGKTDAEAAGAKDSMATAQSVFGSLLPLTNTVAVNITGDLTNAGEVDYFAFDAVAGSLITANAQSEVLETNTTIDCLIDLLDSTGSVLVTSDDIAYDDNEFMTGGSFYGLDSLIQNFEAQYSGRYYLRIRAFGNTDIGNYELLMTGLNPVPEPGTIAAVGAGMLFFARRRKRSQK